MTKHKDIDKASALLNGISWHIDASYQDKRKTNRPDKRRCKYYDKNKKCAIVTKNILFVYRLQDVDVIKKNKY